MGLLRIATAGLVLVLVLASCGANHPAAHTEGGGSWRVAYNGFGRVASYSRDGQNVFTLAPERPTSLTQTHAALMLSAGNWSDFSFTVRLRTAAQLRHPQPNAWEVAWVLWHFTDDKHFYYLILKPNGFELGKEDPSYPGSQRFLVTGTEPAFPVGRWYVVRIDQRADVITISVDGRGLLRFVDSHTPYLAGRLGLYTEDASAAFEPLQLSSAR